MTQSLKSIVPLIALIAVLAMAPVAPEAGNTLFLAAGAIGLLLMWPEAIVQVRRPIVWMQLTGLGLVGVAYGVSAGIEGLVGLLPFNLKPGNEECANLSGCDQFAAPLGSGGAGGMG